MDFNLTEEQEMLRASVRDFLSDRCPKTLVSEVEKGGDYSADLWKEVARLGWIGLVFPEHYGGGGCSFTDLCVLLEEMGYACLTGPFFTTIFGGLLILDTGSEKQKDLL